MSSEVIYTCDRCKKKTSSDNISGTWLNIEVYYETNGSRTKVSNMEVCSRGCALEWFRECSLKNYEIVRIRYIK